MPQLVTHNIFAKDVYEKLSDEIKNSIKDSIDVYEMFSQSFDTFMYYLSPNLKKVKKVNKLKSDGHKTNVNKYFMNMFNNIKNNKYENKSQVLSYLFGSINHYTLDSITHPLVFYKTGVYQKGAKETKKYMGLHGDMETQIDAFYYITKYKRLYNKVNVTKEFIPKIIFSNDLKDVVDKTIYQTFNEKDMAKIYFRAYNNSRILYKLFINDKKGVKKFLYKIFDKLYIFKSTKFEYYTTYVKSPRISYLNVEQKTWYYPSNPSIKSNKSFLDLYNDAVEMAVKRISIAYNELSGNRISTSFKEIIGNNSYVRGLDCDNSKPMKKFEF